MEAALASFRHRSTGATCLDIGASTGGSPIALLQTRRRQIFAIGCRALPTRLEIRSDPRVVVREKLNARHLTRADIPDPITICVIDVSFISLTLILPPAAALLSNGGVIVPLDQNHNSNSRKEDVGKGGVIRDPALHQRAVDKIHAFVGTLSGLAWSGPDRVADPRW